MPYLVEYAFDGSDELRIHLFTVMKEPGTLDLRSSLLTLGNAQTSLALLSLSRSLLRLWHIREDHDGVVERLWFAKILDDGTDHGGGVATCGGFEA